MVLCQRWLRAATGRDRALLILVNIENGGQPRQVKQIMYALAQIGEFHLPTLVPKGRVGLHQFSHSRTVHVMNSVQVQDDCFLALPSKIQNNLAENDVAFAHCNSSGDVNNSYSTHLPDGSLHL